MLLGSKPQKELSLRPGWVAWIWARVAETAWEGRWAAGGPLRKKSSEEVLVGLDIVDETDAAVGEAGIGAPAPDPAFPLALEVPGIENDADAPFFCRPPNCPAAATELARPAGGGMLPALCCAFLPLAVPPPAVGSLPFRTSLAAPAKELAAPAPAAAPTADAAAPTPLARPFLFLEKGSALGGSAALLLPRFFFLEGSST